MTEIELLAKISSSLNTAAWACIWIALGIWLHK